MTRAAIVILGATLGLQFLCNFDPVGRVAAWKWEMDQ